MLVRLSTDPSAPEICADCTVTVGPDALPRSPGVVLVIAADLENGQRVELLLRDYEAAELLSLLSTSGRLEAVRELAAQCAFDPSLDSNF